MFAPRGWNQMQPLIFPPNSSSTISAQCVTPLTILRQNLRRRTRWSCWRPPGAAAATPNSLEEVFRPIWDEDATGRKIRLHWRRLHQMTNSKLTENKYLKTICWKKLNFCNNSPCIVWTPQMRKTLIGWNRFIQWCQWLKWFPFYMKSRQVKIERWEGKKGESESERNGLRE